MVQGNNDSNMESSEINAQFKRFTEIAYELFYRYEISPIKKFSYVSQSALQITGYSPEDHYNDPELGFKIVHPDDKHILENLISNEDFFNKRVVLRWIKKDGSIIWTEQRNIPIYNNGELVAFEGVAHNITSQKLTELSLENELERRKILHEQLPEGVLIIDVNTAKILEFNTAAHNQLGYTREEFSKLSIRDIEAKETPEETATQIYRILKDGYGEFETLQRTKSGEIRNVHVKVKVININGEITYQAIWRDITEYKITLLQRDSALSAQIESEEKFRNAFQYSAIGIALISLEGKWLKVNPVIPKMLGYSEEELLDKTFQELTHPEDLEIDLEYVNKMINCEIESYTLGKRFVHKNGSIIWGNLSVSLVKDANKKPLYFISQIENITEQSLAIEQLKMSERDLNKAQQHAKIGSWTWDIKTNKLHWSEEMYRIFGINKEEFTGSLSDIINEAIHPDDRGAVEQSNLSVIEKKVPIPLEFRIIRKDGTERVVWAEAGELVTNDLGESHLLSGIVQDITERKQTEKALKENEHKYQALVDQSPIAYEVYDENGLQLKVNAAYENMWGMKAEDSVGKFNVRTDPQVEILGIKPFVEKTFAGETVDLPEFKWDPTKSGFPGRARWLKTILYPIKNEHGDVSFVVINHQDVTERFEALEETKASEDRYRKLTDNLPGVTFQFKMSTDGKFSCPFINHKTLQYFGIKAEDIIDDANKLLGLMEKDYFHTFQNNVLDSAQKLTAYYDNIPILIENKRAWFEVRSTPQKLNDGSILWDGIILDVTERINTQNELDKQQFYLTKAQEIGSIGTWELDLKDNSIEWTDESYRIFGVEIGTKINYEFFLGLIHPNDIDYVNKEWILAVEGKPYDIEHRILADGKIKWVREKADLIFDENGKVIRAIGVTQDITERRQSEENRKKNEILLLQAEEISNQGAWEWDLVEDQWIFSENWLRIHGCRLSGITREELMTIAYPEDAPCVDKAFQDALAGRAPYDLEHRIVRKNDSEVRYIRAKGNFVLNDSGQRVKMYGVAQDISERKQAEKKLRAQEEDLKESQRIAHVGSWRLDISTNEVTWSEELYKMYGFDPSLPPPPFNEQQKIYTPQSWNRLTKAVSKTIETGIAYDVELEIVRKDGSNGWMWSHGEVVLDENGKPVGLRGAAQDINERKQAEERLRESEMRFRSTFDKSPLGSVIVGLDKCFIKCNEAFCNFVGYTNDELIGKTIADITYSEDKELGMSELKLLMEGKIESSANIQKRYVHKDGNIKWGEVSISLVRDSNNSPLYFLPVITDITERKRSEEALIESQRLSAIGEMSSAVAHDFNNSLQSIFGNIELALLNIDKENPARKYLDTMNVAASDAATRVQLLQRFAGNNKAGLDFTTIDINQIISEVLVQSRPLWKDKAEKKGLIINIETQIEDDVFIMGNAGDVRSVFYNLIKNSVEAIDKRGTIIIKTINDNGQVRILFKDNGIGMDEKTKTRIFQPFFSTKGFDLGRGLGLSGAYSIIKEHKGKIFVAESKPGKGTTIEINFPKVLPGQVKTDTEIELVSHDTACSILWVDDDEMIREIAEEIISALGHTGDVVGSGEKALKKLESRKYDLIISDIGMPGMNGWELIEIINDKYDRKIKIVLTTGWGDQISEEKKLKFGVSQIVGKPFKLVQLKNIIQSVVNK